MNAAENLKATLAAWREGVKSARTESGETRPKNPYGVKISELNARWSAIRAEHEESIREAKESYQEEMKNLLEKSAAWKKEYPTGARVAGRPKNPDYSDEVKIAAFEMFLETDSKVYVRSVMGINDNPKLLRVLEEGEALLKAQETEEEPW